MKSRIYIETSVVSFYHEVRTEPDMIARRDWTRQFWAMAQDEYTLVTSVAVIEELERGNFPNKENAIRPSRKSKAEPPERRSHSAHHLGGSPHIRVHAAYPKGI